MKTRFPFRTTLVGLAVGVLLALLLAPQSRWLVRCQLAAVGFSLGTPFGSAAQEKETEQQVAAAHPNDYQMQIAAQHGEDNASQYVAYLRTLTPRFGNNPSLYATLLRFQTGSRDSRQGVYLSRSEEGEPGVGVADATPPPPAPALLAVFDADAAQGERLDPNNAYFPLMRAVGLLAAHRDAEGLEAVQRASTKPVWNEYLSDETTGRLRLADAVQKHTLGISQAAIVASVLYQQYTPLRAVARVATVLAMHAEQAGDKARGMSIRRALMMDGDLMRVQSTTYIGSLVGMAISAIARLRPGGSEALKLPESLTWQQWAHARLTAFTQYARQAGFPDDAARAEAQYAAGEAVRAILTPAQNRSVFSPQKIYRLRDWWVGGLLTLTNVGWLLILGLAGVLLSRLPSVRDRQPLPTPAHWGITAAFALAVAIAAFTLSNEEMQVGIAFVIPLSIAGGLTVGALVLRRDKEQRRRSLASFARAFAITACALGGVALVAAWQARGVVDFVQIETDLVGLSGNDGTDTFPPQAAAGLIAVPVGLVVPLMLGIGVSVWGRRRRVPVSAALAAGFRTTALPLACLLVIGYGTLALGTLRQEQQMDDGLRQMIRHEGRYYASLAGTVWPGPA